ncbi:uncharacterized protein LOC113495674 [Trichoplusia ni]|uniref:Uncharacterized protein LOC113495674 n=1 Tax=Trichoplusia ni TaxID=7111 RepID=A0A7E5VPT2_TRINI|nr:uncharacterized protein LOC113495674 [Trichoplusia ni]XP_026730340.1 uncharacterized protein LOC113495674 [Trichoplusia ni]
MEPIAGTSNKSELIKYVKSRKGKRVLLYKNKTHRLIKMYKNGNTLWRCTIQACGAVLTLSKYEDVLKNNEHFCTQNKVTQFVQEVVDDIHQEAMSTLDPLPEVYKRKLNNLLDQGINLTQDIPEFKNVKTTLYNKRNKSLGVKRLFGKSPTDVQVPNSFCNFILADYNDGKRRILLFATQKSKDELGRCRHLYCDGTFKSVPKPFKQLYSIHGDIDGVVKPLVYALLCDKKKSTYKLLFQLLKTTVPNTQVDFFKSDFEEAAMSGFLAVFPNAVVSGCFFHYKQALRRKSRDLGLSKNSIFRKHVALCTLLPHLPITDLDEAWLYIMSQSPQDKNVTKFNDYMVAQWLEHRFWKGKFTCYGEKNKTNNFVESHYSEINKKINPKGGVNLAKLLIYLQNYCNNFAEMRLKMNISENQKHAQERNNIIENILNQYVTGSISIGHCLEMLRKRND